MGLMLKQIGASLYPTQLSVGSIILTVFSLTLAVFFLRPRKKSSTTVHLGLAYLFLSFFHAAYFISFTFYHPLAAYHRWITVPSILAAEIHLTGLILQYPDGQNMRLSRVATLVQYIVLFISTAVFYSKTIRSDIFFRFDGHYYDLAAITAGKYMGIVIMVYSTIFLFAIIIRLFQLKGDDLMRMVLIGIPCVAGATFPAVLNLLNMNGYITRESFQIMLNMCHLFFWLFMALLHLNTTKEKFTFMGKIVGISIVTFLAFFILNSHLTLLDMDKNYDNLKVRDARLHMVEPAPDDGVVFVNSCSFSGKAFTGSGTKNSGSIPPCFNNEYFNTFVYEEIKRIPDETFNRELDTLLAGGGEFFKGYRNFILGINSSLPVNQAGRGLVITRELESMRGYSTFQYNSILSMNNDDFRNQLYGVLNLTNAGFKPFREAMLAFAGSAELNGSELKVQVAKYIEPMNPSGARIYRTDNNRRHFISYIYYDRPERIVYEAGFSYLLYREYMQNSASRMIFIVLTAIIFMIVIYPFFFLGTMYTPLSTLLKGVNRVADGELDFRIDVRIEDEIGEITRTFNTMTDRLRENQDEIARSAGRFRELADMLPDIIYETDIDLNIIYMNRAGYNLAGYSRDNISSGLSLSALLSEKDFRSIKTFSEKCNDIEGAIFSRTHDICKKDGGSFSGENRAVFIYNENGVSGLRGIIRDVTEKIKTEEALLQVQKMETIGTLVAGLAHDFNNILAGITGPLSMIRYTIEKQGSIDADDFNVYIETMNESSRRAVDLVQQLVNLSRKDSIALVPVDLVHSLKHVIRICTSAFDRNIEIVANIPEHPVMVMGDTTQVEQMLLNICINGNHAMTIMRPLGDIRGGRLVLSVDEIQPDEHFMAVHPEAKDVYYWRVSVSDTGVGMDSSIVSKIFIPFFTTKQRGTGTGLGLAMVYNIVKHHRGFVDVYSEPGMGTTFSIFLPELDKQEEAAAVSRNVPVVMGDGLILVADDEEAIRLTARMMLEKCGYDVITAVDGQDAVRVYGEHAGNVKAVILDLLMPKMSGEVAAMELRKLNPDVKILLASGMIHDERADRIASDYKCVFIQKPYTFEVFSRAVYNLINDIRQ
ncbi:MAG TPA: ATP-binding protein [Spirochaetota bacterium]|nr:ATP-binding protein [Spirochaetota bacterium]